VTDRARRCAMCGRLAYSLADGYCSPRCAELAERGYAAPPFAAAALAAPRTRFDARLLVDGPLPPRLPAGCADIGSAGAGARRRALVRIGAEQWDDLEERIRALRDALRDAGVEVLTLQEFVPQGLGGSAPESDRRRNDGLPPS
jgi:hypothetical protein